MKYNGRTTMVKGGELGGTCQLPRAANNRHLLSELFPVREGLPLGGSREGERVSREFEDVPKRLALAQRAFAKGSRARRENLPQSAVAARRDKRGRGGGPQKRGE